MKIRSILLVTCLVVVPLIAMFSHRIPPATRAAVGRWLGDMARGSRPIAPAGVPASVEPAVRVSSAAEAPRVVPVAAVVPVSAARSVPEHENLERLRALGAVAIDCSPLPGGGGHVASCRVPVDGAGQLERLFQAVGADPAAATDKLLGDVSAWQRGSTPGPSRTMRF